MRYSQWLPDRGGYAYYETSERRGLGDDLPIPQLKQISDIGVASTDVGRAMPLGAKLVGYGAVAVGSIVPLDRSGLSGLGGLPSQGTLLLGALAAAAAAVGVVLVRKLKR